MGWGELRSAAAADNPFQMIEYGAGIAVAADAVDMQGNKVKIDDATGFSSGGDQAAGYASGKLGTGAKDPAVCGTFSGSSCSMPHISAGAAMGAMKEEMTGKMMDKAMEGMEKMKDKL